MQIGKIIEIISFKNLFNGMGGVIVNMLASSAVDQGCQP
jgi:hypothetical protein